MPGLFKLATALVLASLSAAAPAELVVTPFEKVGNWQIERAVDGDLSYCNMSNSYKSGILMISLVPTRQFSTLLFESAQPSSLKEGDKASFEIALVDAAEKLDRGWGSPKFDVYLTDSGSRHYVTAFDSQFVDDLARNRFLAMLDKGKVYMSYKIDAPAAPVAALKRCAAAVLAGSK